MSARLQVRFSFVWLLVFVCWWINWWSVVLSIFIFIPMIYTHSFSFFLTYLPSLHSYPPSSLTSDLPLFLPLSLPPRRVVAGAEELVEQDLRGESRKSGCGARRRRRRAGRGGDGAGNARRRCGRWETRSRKKFYTVKFTVYQMWRCDRWWRCFEETECNGVSKGVGSRNLSGEKNYIWATDNQATNI